MRTAAPPGADVALEASQAAAGLRTRRDELVAEVASRVPLPLDELELTAVIESIGVTDEVAGRKYDYDSSFELAAAIFPRVLEASDGVRSMSRTSLLEQLIGRGRHDVASGVLAVLPFALLLVSMEILARAGWDQQSLLAVMTGVALAMLCVSGPILALGHRAAIFIGFEQDRTASKLLAKGSVVLLGACAALSTGVALALAVLDVGTASLRFLIVASTLGFALIWLLIAIVTFTASSVTALIGMAGGCAAAVVASLQYDGVTGLEIGWVTAVVALAGAWVVIVWRQPAPGVPIPATPLLLREARPYIAYGTIFSSFFLAPQISYWLGEGRDGSLEGLEAVQLSLLVALPPLLLAAVAHTGAVKRFIRWVHLDADQLAPHGFRVVVALRHRRVVRENLVLVVVGSALTVLVVETVMIFGRLADLNEVVFVWFVLGFGLLAIAQFTCLTMISLSCVEPAARAAGRGLSVLLAGLAVAPLGSTIESAVFALAAFVFALAAARECKAVLEEVDYRYATAF